MILPLLKRCEIMLSRLTLILLSMLVPVVSHAAQAEQTFDLGVESMRSHSYSVGIFIFMMIAIAVFVGIIIGYLRTQKASELKAGEKVLFAMIILGVLGASIFAAVQLLDGFLF